MDRETIDRIISADRAPVEPPDPNARPIVATTGPGSNERPDRPLTGEGMED
jgi:hypothetical protein